MFYTPTPHDTGHKIRDLCWYFDGNENVHPILLLMLLKHGLNAPLMLAVAPFITVIVLGRLLIHYKAENEQMSSSTNHEKNTTTLVYASNPLTMFQEARISDGPTLKEQVAQEYNAILNKRT